MIPPRVFQAGLKQSLIEDQTAAVVDIGHIIQGCEPADAPIGMGGCRVLGPCSFDPCEYDLFIFDGDVQGGRDTITVHDDKIVIVRHASLLESDSERLLQYDGLRVIRDDSWSLNMMLLRIKEKRHRLYADSAKNALIRALFCCQKVTERPDVFALCWQRAASFHLADAICTLNHRRPSPSHMLETLRSLPKNSINEHLQTVTNTIGMERATPTLLERMAKSAGGFSDMINKMDGHSGLIIRKYDFFVSKSMLADCYFYLGYISKENMSKTSATLHRSPELIHVLRIAIDAETDHMLSSRHTELIQNSCRELLRNISQTDAAH